MIARQNHTCGPTSDKKLTGGFDDVELMQDQARVRDAYQRAINRRQTATSSAPTHQSPQQFLPLGEEEENETGQTTLKIHILWQEKAAEFHVGQYMLLIKGMRGVLYRQLSSGPMIRVYSEECRGFCQSQRSFLHDTRVARALRGARMLLAELRYLRRAASHEPTSSPATPIPRRCPDPSSLAPCDAEFCLRRVAQNGYRFPKPRNSGASPSCHGQNGDA